MSNDFSKETRHFFSNEVVTASQEGNQLTIQGRYEVSEMDTDRLVFVAQQRRTKETYFVKQFLMMDSNWTVVFDLTDGPFDEGIWDFYFQYDEKKYRIKVAPSFEAAGPLGAVLANQLQTCTIYRTIKDSLSLKIELTKLSLEELHFQGTRENSASRDVIATVHNKDVLQAVAIEGGFVRFMQRKTERMVDCSATIADQFNEIQFSYDYDALLAGDSLAKDSWDCYFVATIAGNEYPLRIHLALAEDRLKVESIYEFDCPNIHQVYFYETVYHHLSIKIHRVPLRRNIRHCTLSNKQLIIEGEAYLERYFDAGDLVERTILIRKRESDLIFAQDLVDRGRDGGQFRIEVPLEQLVATKKIEREIYDIDIQLRVRGHMYERRLGFESFTYERDGALDRLDMKYRKHYARIYATTTPGGNLRIETYHLSRWAYYYLRYFQKLDQLLHRGKRVWLVGERTDTAQDTGYQFFKYCRTKHPKEPIYYVIQRNAKDRKNVERFGHVLYSGTLQHVRKLALADTFIGSHELDNLLPFKGQDIEGFDRSKRVFLQHGVLGRKPVEYNKAYYRYPFQLFCVSSQSEKELVKEKYGYDEAEVQVTGLSRFDALKGHTSHMRRSIVIMPTWRDWIGNREQFRQSLYYQSYRSLLENKQLHELLERHDMKLDFYIHYRMQTYADLFDMCETDRIRIRRLGEESVQQLLMDNQLLVTDYSSVSFDFNYMKKPVIFYHFDVKRFFRPGLLRPLEETFLGDICTSEDDILQTLDTYIQNDFQEKQTFSQQKDQLFAQMDTKNSERIYQAIQQLDTRLQKERSTTER